MNQRADYKFMAAQDKRAIIFDADGTLYSVRTAKAYSRLYDFMSKKTGMPRAKIKARHELELARIRNSKSPRLRSHLYSIFKTVGNRRIAKLAEAEFWKGVLVIKRPGTKTVLETLKRKGYRLAIASDEFYGRLAEKLESALGADWTRHFGCVVTPESAKVMKPSGRYYRMIMRKFTIKPSAAVVVGNSWDKDLQPAARLGMTTVLIGGKKSGKPDFFIRKISSLLKIMGAN